MVGYALMLCLAAGAELVPHPGLFVATLHHDVASELTLTGSASEVEWPEELRQLGAVVEDLGDTVSVSISRRDVHARFSGSGRSANWYYDIATRARAVPGVLDAVCLPPVLGENLPGCEVDGIVSPRPTDPVVPDTLCPGLKMVLLDVVVDTNGENRDPVLSSYSPSMAPDCEKAILEWVLGLTWDPGQRINGYVPASVSVPLWFE